MSKHEVPLTTPGFKNDENTPFNRRRQVMHGGSLEASFMCSHTAHPYGQIPAACIFVRQRYVPAVLQVIRPAFGGAAVGGKRAGGGRGKQHVQTARGSEGAARGRAWLTALMNVKNKLRYVA